MVKNIFIRRSFWVMLFFGLALGIMLFLHSRDMNAGGASGLPWYVGAYAVYAAAVFYIYRFWGRTFISLEIILVIAVAVRIFYVVQEASPEVYRQEWDGRVSNIGVNPYAYTPDAPFLMGLQDSVIYFRLGDQQAITTSAPLLQIISAGIVYVTESVWTFKILYALLDLTMIFLLTAILRHFDRAIAWVTVYAWNPLVILEISGHGRAEILPMVLIMTAVLLALKCRPIWAAIPLAAAASFNVVWTLMITFFEDFKTRLKTTLILVFMMMAVVTFFFKLYQEPLIPVFHYIHEPVIRETNSSVYWIIHYAITAIAGTGGEAVYTAGFKFTNQAQYFSVIIALAIVALLWATMTVRFLKKTYAEQKQSILYYVYGYMTLYLIISPAASPVMILFILPLLCFHPQPAWLWLAGTAGLIDGWDSLQTGLDIRILEYAPFYAIWIIYAIRLWMKRRKTFHHLEPLT